MANAMAVQSTGGPTSGNADLILRLLTLWRAAFGTVMVVAAGMLWLTPVGAEMALWVRILATAVTLGLGVASLMAVPAIMQRNHRGRTLSLFVDYLGFVACLLASLQIMQIFLGINALANTFGAGLPYLLIVLGGYLVGTIGDRYEDYPKTQRSFRRVSRVIMAIGGVIFFFAISGPRGLLFVGKQMTDPVPGSLLFATVIFALGLWAMWRQSSADAMHAKNSHSEMLNGWLFLSPNLLGFLIFFAGPLLLSLYFSFTNSDAFNPPRWIGLQNYADILHLTILTLSSPTQAANSVMDMSVFSELARFTVAGRTFLVGAEDKLFWISLRNTIVFALAAVPLSIIPALVLASVLNSKLPGMKMYRAIYFLPSIAAVVGIALVWQVLLYNSSIGYINYVVTSVVNFLNSSLGMTLIDPKIQWLSSSGTALLSIIILFAWQTMGFNTVLFMAGLQNIPGELYEAATVDGAGSLAKFFRITIPLLASTTFFVVTTTGIQAMQVFEQIFILMNPPEGPNNSTVSLVLYLYRSGFQNFRQGYASAIAWVLFLVIFSLTLVQFQRQRAETAN